MDINEIILEKVRRVKHVALDMDGTIYNGGTLFPFTIGFLDKMKELGIGYSFLTNNPSRSTNDYLKHLNDMGIIGQRIPKPDSEKCRGCKKCQIEKSCPVHVPKLVDGKLYIDPEECIHCGRCKGKCPFGAVPEYQNGYKIYIGGRWGKRISHGQALTRIFTEEEEVMAVIEKAILLFKNEGIAGERFADTVKRLGFEYVNEKLIG